MVAVTRGRTMALVGAVGLALAGAAALFWSRSGDDGGDAPAAALALGAPLYAEHCASCHGANLEGEPDWQKRKPDGLLPAPPHDATGHTWHHTDAQLFAITKHGTAALVGPGYMTAMRGFGDILSDAEIGAVIAYIKSTWPAEIRARQAEINARAGAGH